MLPVTYPAPVIMYADNQTEAMSKAIEETDRRRAKMAHNARHGIDPAPLIKKICDVNDMFKLKRI